MRPTIRFSEDVVPLSTVKVNPGRIVAQVDKTHRPVLLTSHGKGVAVIQSLTDFEADSEEKEFMRAVVEGLMDVEEGRITDVATVKRDLGIG